MEAERRRLSPQAQSPGERPPPIGRLLRASGALGDEREIGRALARARRIGARLGELLQAEGRVSPRDVAEALGRQIGARAVDLDRMPPDPRLLRPDRAADWLAAGLVPWRRAGGRLVVAAEDPAAVRPRLAALGLPADARLVVAPRDQIERHLARLAASALVARAETLCPAPLSCRRHAAWLRPALALALLAAAAAALAAPAASWWAALGLATLFMLANTALRAAALLVRPAPDAPPAPPGAGPRPLPMISLLVPLYREAAAVPGLLAALGRMHWPRARLECLLLLEDDDAETRAALPPLPPWARVVVVPEGTLRTKPRAMNYALPFCRGQLVGIYDAEDRPDPDQLRQVAAAFARGGARVAAVQAALAPHNWRAGLLPALFALEYAGWFRVVLPAIARLGGPVPLGGTAVFLRRGALEALGGWDAHNVTEDADLGMRIARAGLRTEVIASLSQEEATTTPWRWIRQRTRWLKGYALTWAVHMARPGRLLAELGPWGFAGFNLLFLGTIGTFALAPALWALWALSFGLDPGLPPLDPALRSAAGAAFLACEGVNAAVAALGALRNRCPALLARLPLMPFYWPLATVAVWRALAEIVWRPFRWDKTEHGAGPELPHAAPQRRPAPPAPPPRRRRVRGSGNRA
ncbi:MAG: glycosyltransferase [Alphaproteobacteria bacterium]|nr:MAG: glycosyltransferase [Alphaproteobacteria bacterium]